MALHPSIPRRCRLTRWALLLACFFAAPPATRAATTQPVRIQVYSAAPAGLESKATDKAFVQRRDDAIVLGNGLLAVEIALANGAVRAVENRLTGQTHLLAGDAVGFDRWTPRDLQVSASVAADGQAKIVLQDRSDSRVIRIIYTVTRTDFWIRRRINIARDDGQPVKLDALAYGRLHIAGGERRQLTLGKFDRPSIVRSGAGGVFAGVEHWYYRADDDGTFANTDMAWEQPGPFESEAWYLGVFADEPGEPYPGWMWYRTYLQRAREEAFSNRAAASFTWNAGWGQWGIDIDDASAGQYLELMKQLGIDVVIFGSGGFGKGIAGFTELAQSNEAAKANVALLKRLSMAGGTLNNGAKPWGDASRHAPLLAELDRYVAAGFGATAFDFFESRDTYAAHRRVAEYFRRANETLAYTECHLGMAAYGPQFQRMARVNHPDDIAGFDISHFSSNWATFLAFRHSRRNWQRKYDYLMPEDGLYYYLTHYANWGNPRRYTDPEPQQFLWSVPAYCGIGFNFHDAVGWRESIAAASAFTTAPIFGHIELKMPPRDIEFARSFFDWMRANAAVLRPSRVCAEDESACVVSKIIDGKGVIYVVNYGIGARDFELLLKTGHAGPLVVSQVYPSRERSRDQKDGDTVLLRVRGESCAILEVNGALRSLPPVNARQFPVDLSLQSEGQHWSATIDMPEIRDALITAARDPALPRQILCLDQVQDSRPDLLVPIAADANRNVPAVKWIGKGKPPKEFLDVYGIGEGGAVATSKIVPWAFTDRVWLVLRPHKPIPLAGPHPTLTINSHAVEFSPRVDHRFEKVEQWNCPLYHADVTQAAAYGAANEVTLSIPGQTEMPIVFVTSAAERK